MAGIDKIYLKDYNEYIYFRNFLEKHELEFFKKHKYSLYCELFDIDKCYFNGDEIPISNFCTEADVFIIQHLSEKDIKSMPNVVARLKQQYEGDNHGFDLIRQHKSEYDRYQIDRSGCKIKLVERSNNKTLKHIKREKWDEIRIDVYSNRKKRKDFYKYSLSFDYFSRIIFHKQLGCKYYKYISNDDIGNYCDQFLYNVSMKQVCRYITKVRLKRGFGIWVRCCNYQRDSNGAIIDITSKEDYLFEVI